MKVMKRLMKVLLISAAIIFGLWIGCEQVVHASDEMVDSFLYQIDQNEINEIMRSLYPDKKFEFGNLVKEIMNGKVSLTADTLNRYIKEMLFTPFYTHKKGIIVSLVLIICSALCLNVASIFQSRQIGDISFLMLYMVLAGVCMASFQQSSGWVCEGLRNAVGFMKIWFPIYVLAISIAKGSASAGVYYHLTLLLIALLDLIIIKIIIPVIHIYLMICILNSFYGEDSLEKASELIQLVVEWALKALLGVMIGLNLVQGLLAPSIDTVRRSTLSKGAQMIPGIGNVLSGTTEVILGTAVLIKNSIGIAGAFICMAIFLNPLIQMGVVTLCYKFVAAITQPFGDKRFVGCVSSVGTGCQLMMKTLFVCGALALISIAIISYTTNSV